MSMRWCDLLFAHWRADADILRRWLPAGLELDLFEGHAYVGVVPFRMEGVAPRGLPEIPGLHAFPELNLRTYVTVGGKPGVWFFSLDAGQKLAVRVARGLFHLPYFDARMVVEPVGDRVGFSSVRANRSAAFKSTYRAVGPTYRSKPGTLESWLTERYCLYAADRAGLIYRGNIAHEPWPLQGAEAEISVNTLGDQWGIAMEGEPEMLHFVRELTVRAWLLERVPLVNQ